MSEIEDFRRLWSEATDAKNVMLEAQGNAKLAELRENDRDAFELWAERSATKERADALKEGKPIAEVRAITADKYLAMAPESSEEYWNIVIANGINGVEGAKKAEALAVAESWVLANPEKVAEIKSLVWQYQIQNPTQGWNDLQATAPLCSMYRGAGLIDKLTEVEMYQLASFEREHIGGQVRAIARFPNQRKSDE